MVRIRFPPAKSLLPELEVFGDGPLAKLGAVERLLITEQQWCKGRLRDKDGRFCLAGAMQAVEARGLLDPIILRAIREVGGKRYWRIESFNDHPSTTHADVLRVLRRARENVIAGVIEDNPRPWHKRWLQTLCWVQRGPPSRFPHAPQRTCLARMHQPHP
jgi:hypothetical protein